MSSNAIEESLCHTVIKILKTKSIACWCRKEFDVCKVLNDSFRWCILLTIYVNLYLCFAQHKPQRNNFPIKLDAMNVKTFDSSFHFHLWVHYIINLNVIFLMMINTMIQRGAEDWLHYYNGLMRSFLGRWCGDLRLWTDWPSTRKPELTQFIGFLFNVLK